MNTLAQHIETLLLEHDCVIIPGFGGFISNYEEAQYHTDNGSIFMPPHRSIGFNQQLQINDGLLVQSYMSAYDASYPAAHLQMEKEIEQMASQLELDGEYDFGAVGKLTKGLGEIISFDKSSSNIEAPSLFGLDSLSVMPVKSIIEKREIEAKMQAASIGIGKTDNKEDNDILTNDKKQEVVIRLNQRWIDFGISVAAAVLLFFGISYTAMKDVATESDTVIAATYPVPNSQHMNNGNITQAKEVAINKAAQKGKEVAGANTTATTKQEPVASHNTTANPKQEHIDNHNATKADNENATKADNENATKATQENKAQLAYTIVLASYVGKANAEEYVNQLGKKGYNEAQYVRKGKVGRVIYSGYTTEKEAQNALASLRKKSKDFTEAWVMPL